MGAKLEALHYGCGVVEFLLLFLLHPFAKGMKSEEYFFSSHTLPFLWRNFHRSRKDWGEGLLLLYRLETHESSLATYDDTYSYTVLSYYPCPPLYGEFPSLWGSDFPF